MSAHLTNEELTDRLLDEPSMTVDAHLLDCAACRAELNKMRTSVEVFRTAAHSWSDNAAAIDHNGKAMRPRRQKVRTAEWAVAAALLLAVVVLPIVYWRDHVQTKSNALAAQVFQAQIKQDNELLSAVNSEIAEGVPAPMQPLRVSLSYGSASLANQTK
jgi:predicted anti-sigma-YlaC factor YlaD